MPHNLYDVCIIGGGINGAGIARDAAGRGLSVLLVEAGDLGGATSSASTKLIHGGLRYLEYYEFRLVREALAEREVLLSQASHIIRPLEFVLPHNEQLRPRWMIRAGLFLYDHLAGRQKLAASKGLNLNRHPYGAPLLDEHKNGFSYSDCWVDDARLVVANAMDAYEHGARIITRTACTKLERGENDWTIHLKNMNTGEDFTRRAVKIVNAAGPWVRGVLENSDLAYETTPKIRLVKGSHIVVPRLFEGEQAYILQQPDKRIVFAIPYEESYTLIGTTDVDYRDDPTAPAISDDETEYLCDAVNRYFRKKIEPYDVVWNYSGVRPLLQEEDEGAENASAATRDYKLHMDDRRGPAILSVFGGKITTYRKLSEHATDMLCHERAWTATRPLPGGKFRINFDDFLEEMKRRYRWLPEDLLERYAHTYGTRMIDLIHGAQRLKDMGKHFGNGLYEREVRYLVDTEWARTADDILWRRTKLGLHVKDKTVKMLESYLSAAK